MTTLQHATVSTTVGSKASAALRAYRFVGAVVVAGCAYLVWDVGRQSWSAARSIVLARDSGLFSLTLLLVALCVSPVARAVSLAGGREPLGAKHLRRGFGIAAACCALPHAGLASYGVLQGAFGLLLESAHLRAGLAALCVLCVLLLTSFPAVVRGMHLHTWKELHRLAYVAALLALLHALLSPFSDPAVVLALFACAGLLAPLRLLRRAASALAQNKASLPDSRQKRSSTPR